MPQIADKNRLLEWTAVFLCLERPCSQVDAVFSYMNEIQVNSGRKYPWG